MRERDRERLRDGDNLSCGNNKRERCVQEQGRKREMIEVAEPEPNPHSKGKMKRRKKTTIIAILGSRHGG